MVWRGARLCPEKARKGLPVWTVVVLGECLEEVAGCPSHFPTWQLCVEEDTRGALTGAFEHIYWREGCRVEAVERNA